MYNAGQDIATVKRLTPNRPKAIITFAPPDVIGKTAQLIGKSYPTPEATHVIDGQARSVPLDPFVYILQVPGSP